MRSVCFVVYEHQRLTVGGSYASPSGGVAVFTEAHWESLARYQTQTGSKALKVGYRTVTLAQHVGYLRVGPVRLEIYPKLGAHRPEEDWRGLLFHMLRVVAGVRLSREAQSPLRARVGDLWDILLRRYLDLLDALLHEGLVHSYREVESNENAFRGRLLVGPHLRHNHVHRQRVFVAYEVFDAENLLNRVLRRALERVLHTASAADILHRAEAAESVFPPVGEALIIAADWDRLRLDRRTARYREAVDLARLILSDTRPDLRWGERDVVSLLFDMNALFESYLEKALRGLDGVHVRAQVRRSFWHAGGSGRSVMKPDLLLSVGEARTQVVVDAKWKVPPRDRPADDDLRQLFAYLHGFEACRGVLVYPAAGPGQHSQVGWYLDGDKVGCTAFVELFPRGVPDLTALRAALPTALGLDI